MKLTQEFFTPREVAEMIGVSPDTIRIWINNGTIPSEYVIRLRTGRIKITRQGVMNLLAQKGIDVEKKTVIYARESSHHQKDSLKKQVDALIDWANHNGYRVDEVITDLASGMNFNRPGLHKLIEMAEKGELKHVIIAYKDRLARFGFEFIQWLLNKHGCEIIIVNHLEDKPNSQSEIVEDMIAIIHYFAMKLYGARSYKRKAKSIEECILNETQKG